MKEIIHIQDASHYIPKSRNSKDKNTWSSKKSYHYVIISKKYNAFFM